MFWRFGFHNPSAVDTLLEREDVTLEEILEEEEILQEAKSHNQKLINFLCQPANSEKLLYYITANNLEEGQKFKYPFLSSEIIACEIPQLLDVIITEQKELLETFWQFLDRPVHHQDNNNHKSDTDAAADVDATATDNENGNTSSGTDEDTDSGMESLLASYFAKTITVFLTKQPAEMLEFIESKPGNLNKILNHLHSSAVMDLLLTLVRMEELPEGKGIVRWLSDGGLMENLVDRLNPYLDTEEHSIAQQCICEIIRMSQTSLVEQPSIGLNDLVIKLKSETMMRKLAGFMLDPKAPNATSTLINGVTIIIDLIRHNNSDMENDPMLNTTYGYNGNNAIIRPTSVSLADMLRVLADHVMDFNRLLTEPRSVTGLMRTSIGEQIPLGFERLKICELFAELLHCSNMSNLNAIDNDIEETEGSPLSELSDQEDKNDSTNGQDDNNIDNKDTSEHLQAETKVEDPSTSTTTNNATAISSSELDTNKSENDGDQEKKPSEESTTAPIALATDDKLQDTTNTTEASEARDILQQDQQRVLPMGDYLKLQLVQHKVLPTCTNLFFAFPWNNFLHYVTYDMLHQVFNGGMDKGYNRLLALSILKDGQLTTNMVKAQKENDEEWAKPKGMRLGYMGHLTFIADEVIKLFEGYPEAIVQDIKDDVDLDLWYQYCENELRETKERDCLPLGGDRPNDDDAAMHEEDDEEDELDGSTASQYSRYLAQREADGGLEDDEDDAHWITGRNDNVYGNAFSVMDDGQNQVSVIDNEAEYDSDEEEHDNQVITQDWSRGFTEFPQSNMLRRTQSHIEDGYDETEGSDYDHFAETDITSQQPHQQYNITNDNGDDDDPFGEFTSSENGIQHDDDGTWGVSTRMGQLDISTDSKKMTPTENTGFGDKTIGATTASPQTIAATSTLSEDHYVPAIRTKEEDEKYRKSYQLDQDEEQEGEI
ncbi:SIT4 phosphatase-associated protein-domain-containing protein [Absidia repens]|uniref:SIT4 phosphatase-associated protein-domain-containing protein n=1 Tax=Absidia repens TaxID=90262 RepID=A0A1X2IIE2_9FUNG|nr:SIT4 phosphatase-associated protein-domain-containing protein [Absidia repens]